MVERWGGGAVHLYSENSISDNAFKSRRTDEQTRGSKRSEGMIGYEMYDTISMLLYRLPGPPSTTLRPFQQEWLCDNMLPQAVGPLLPSGSIDV